MAVTKVVMPKLSEAMETGKIIKWLKKEGDRIQGGDILAEIETDKADVEMEAFGAGVLRKVLVPAGEKAPVGTLIGVIAEPGDDIAGVLASAPAPAVAAPPAAPAPAQPLRPAVVSTPAPAAPAVNAPAVGDRKSTRLNSSHLVISYAVFCLKKKKTKQEQVQLTLRTMHKSRHTNTV